MCSPELVPVAGAVQIVGPCPRVCPLISKYHGYGHAETRCKEAPAEIDQMVQGLGI